MKKILLMGALAALALGLAPAHAEIGNGCQLLAGEQNTGVSCDYFADGAGAFVAATPNSYQIRVERGDQTIVLVDASTSPPTGGQLPTQAGDHVFVDMGPDCVPGDFVCGTIGILIVGDAE